MGAALGEVELDEGLGDEGVEALLDVVLLGILLEVEEGLTELLLTGVAVTLEDEAARFEEDLDEDAGSPAEAPCEVLVETAFT